MNGAENGSFNPEAGGVSAEWTDLGGYTDEQGRVSADRLRRDFPQMPNEPDGDYEARISSMLGDAGESAGATPEPESSVDRSEIEADLRGSYPQRPDESAEDYEARIAGMVAKTEEGYSEQARAEERERAEMENREAARELEAFYRDAEDWEKVRVRAELRENADKFGGTDNDQYKDAAGRQRRASESKMRELRSRIDGAVAAGEAKKLLNELKEERRVGVEREYYMISGEMGRDGIKIGEEIEGEEKKLKEAYEKLRKIEGGIRRTKEGIVAIESDIEGLKKDLETKEEKAKDDYDRFLERIDALPQAIYGDDRKETMRRGYERVYKEELEKAKKEYAELLENKGKELTEKQESLQAQEQERTEVKSLIASVNGRIANIKRRAQEAFPYEREEEGDEANWHGDKAYEQWLESHQPEETKEEPVEGNDGEKDAGSEDGSSEVDKGISGEGEDATGEGSGANNGEDDGADKKEKAREELRERLSKLVTAMRKEFDAFIGGDVEAKARLDKMAEEMLAMKEEFDALKGNGSQPEAKAAETGAEGGKEKMGAATEEDLRGMSETDRASLSREELDAMDAAAKAQWEIPLTYATDVPIDTDMPVDFYIDQMRRIYDLKIGEGDMVVSILRQRYSEAKLEKRVGDADNAEAFIESVGIDDCREVPVFAVMDMIKSKFFAGDNIEEGEARDEFNKLRESLRKKYEEDFGLDARGKEIEAEAAPEGDGADAEGEGAGGTSGEGSGADGEELKKEGFVKRATSRILGVFRRRRR